MQKLFLALFTIFHSIGFVAYGQTASDTILVDRPMDYRGFFVKVGDTIPDITFNLTDGSIIILKDQIGKVVLLQFTASWCGPCREEMPHIESELWLKYKDKGLIVIGVDYDEPISKVKKLKRQTGVTYPLALDPSAAIFSQFAHKYSGVTRNVVLNQKGEVIFLTRLFQMDEFNKMVAAIENALEP